MRTSCSLAALLLSLVACDRPPPPPIEVVSSWDARVPDRVLALEHTSQAWQRSGQGDLQGQVAAATQALEIDPDEQQALKLRAWGRAALGDAEGALADATRACELDPARGPWSLEAGLRGQARDPARQEAALSARLELHSGDSDLMTARGWVRAEQGDFAGALSDATAAFALSPHDASALRLRAWMLEETGDLAGAERERARLAAFDPRPALRRPELPDASALAAAEEAGREDRAGASELAAAQSDAIEWDAAGDRVAIEAHYRGSENALEIALTRRPGVEGRVSVSFPPGTWAEAPSAPWVGERAAQQQEVFPRSQDLALVRARVITLEPGGTHARVSMPIVCAAFHAEPPRADSPYTLRRFEAGSPLERLSISMCAGDAPPTAAAQLATWILRDGIRWTELAAHQQGTFGAFTGESYGMDALPEAALLLARAQVDPQATAMFDQLAGNFEQ